MCVVGMVESGGVDGVCATDYCERCNFCLLND